MIVDSAIYVDGRRTAEVLSPQETYEAFRRQRGGLAWIGLDAPSEEEFSSVAREFGLHPLAVEDAVNANQMPKLERYDGGTLFVVLRPARYVDGAEIVEFGEFHVFMGEDFVVTVRHGESSELGIVRHRLEGDRALLRVGPQAILFAPTLVGAVYGMNFDYMPELYWTLGYPFALALMLVVSASLYLAFKRRGWL